MISPRAKNEIAGGDFSLRLFTFEVAPPTRNTHEPTAGTADMAVFLSELSAR